MIEITEIPRSAAVLVVAVEFASSGGLSDVEPVGGAVAGGGEPVLDNAHAAVALARDIGDRRVEAEALNVLALVQQADGHYREAARHHRHALDLARRNGDRAREVAALIGLATALLRPGSTGEAAAEAAEAARRALAISRRAGYRVLEGQALTVLADVHLAQLRADRAVSRAQQALAAHRATGHRLGEARSLLVLARALRHTDDAGAAEAHQREAHAILEAAGAEVSHR